MEIEPHSPWTSSTILSSLACDSSSFGLGVIPVAPKLLGKVILIVKSTIIKFLCKTPLAKHRKILLWKCMCLNIIMLICALRNWIKIISYTVLRLLNVCYSLLQPLINLLFHMFHELFHISSICVHTSCHSHKVNFYWVDFFFK